MKKISLSKVVWTNKWKNVLILLGATTTIIRFHFQNAHYDARRVVLSSDGDYYMTSINNIHRVFFVHFFLLQLMMRNDTNTIFQIILILFFPNVFFLFISDSYYFTLSCFIHILYVDNKYFANWNDATYIHKIYFQMLTRKNVNVFYIVCLKIHKNK